MCRGRLAAGAVVSVLLVLGLMIVVLSTSSVFAQLDATAQHQTVMAMVELRFTQTAKASTPVATIDLEGTASAMFFQLLTETAAPAVSTSAPSLPPAPSPTPNASGSGINTALPSAPSRTPMPESTRVINTAPANAPSRTPTQPLFQPQASATPNPEATQTPSAEDYLTRGWEIYWDAVPDYDTATLAFSLAAYRAPDWAEPYVGIGISQLEYGEYDRAIGALTQAIELDSNDADLYMWRAIGYQQLRLYELMLEDANQMVLLNPNRAIGYEYQAIALQGLERYEEALEALDTSLIINPDSTENFQRRFDVHTALEDSAAARFDGFLVNGLFQLYAGDYEAANDEFTRAINGLAFGSSDTLTPAFAYYNRAVTNVQLSDFEAALDDLTSAILLIPDFAEAYTLRATIQGAFMDEYDGVLDDLNQAIAVNPDHPSSYLARALFNEGTRNTAQMTSDYWNFIRLYQSRDIIWDRYTSGEAFTLEMGDGWVYYVPFSGVEGQPINVSAQAVRPNEADADPLIAILDAAGNPLIAVDNGVELNASIQNFSLPVDGAYTLIVSHAAGGSGGPVRVILDLSSEAASPSANPTSTPTLRSLTNTPTPLNTPTFAPTQTNTRIPTAAVASNQPPAAAITPLNAAQITLLDQIRSSYFVGLRWQPDSEHLFVADIANIYLYTADHLSSSPFIVHMEAFGGVIDISPDGQRLAINDGDNISIIDTSTGRQLASLFGHSGSATDLEFSQDNHWLVSGSDDATIRIWDMETFAQAAVLRGHEDSINSIAISSDNQFIVSASLYDGMVNYWDISELESADAPIEIDEPTQTVANPPIAPLSVAISPDSEYVAVGDGEGEVQIWRVTETPLRGQPQHILRGHEQGVTVLRFSPNSDLLASGGWDNVAILWDVSTGDQLITLPQQSGDITDIAFSPDNMRLATLADNVTLSLWGISETKQTANLNTPTSTPTVTSTFAPTIAPTATTIINNGRANQATLIDQADYLSLSGIEWLTDETLLVGGATRYSIFSANDIHQPLQEVVHGNYSRAIDVSADGRLLAVGGRNTVTIIDIETGEELAVLHGHEDVVQTVQFSPDSRWLASGGEDRTIFIWDMETFAETAVLDDHRQEVFTVVWSSDGRQIASASPDDTIRLWDVSELSSLEPDDAPLVIERAAVSYESARTALSLAFSPDGQYFAAGLDNGTLLIWNVNEFLLISQPSDIVTEHQQGVNVLAFSSDSTLLASGGLDDIVNIWNVDTGDIVDTLSLLPVTSEVLYLAFNPAGTQLAAADSDNILWLWELGTAE